MPITSRKKFGWIACEMFIAMAIAKVVIASSMNPRWTCASLSPSDSEGKVAVVSGACPGTAAAEVLLIGAATRFDPRVDSRICELGAVGAAPYRFCRM